MQARLGVGVLIGGLRWFLCAMITDATFLFAVQALHGVTVVGLNLGSPLYLDVVAPEKLRSTAQTYWIRRSSSPARNVGLSP